MLAIRVGRDLRRTDRLANIGLGLLLWACLAFPTWGQDQSSLLRNGDFEAANPFDQQVWMAVPGDFDANPDTATAHSGQSSFRLARAPSSTSPFAAVAQAVDAAPLRGKTVRFRAAARVMGGMTGSSAGLWLRVDREGGARGFFDNMSARPIRSSDWAVYEIVAPVADDATKVTVGFLLNGAGPGWIDTASLEIVPNASADQADGAPLSARELANLTAFTRLYGYIRWFSPYSEPNDPSWDRVASEGAIAAAGAQSSEALTAVLEAWFEPMAPDLVVNLEPVTPGSVEGVAGETGLVRWRHLGVAFASPAYRSERVSADRPEFWRANLGAGLFATFPLTAPRSALPAGPPSDGAQPSRGGSDDRATRLAATIIAWNVFRHFYPYFEDGGDRWEVELESRLRSAATASEPAAFLTVLRSMVADLNDGHGEVGPQSEDFRLPILWQWTENALVITAVARGADPTIAVGDVVVAIDGHPVAQLLADESRLMSASTEAHRTWRAAEALRSQMTRQPVTLSIEEVGGERREVQITPVASSRLAGALQERRPAPVTWFPQGVWYFDLTRLDDRRLNDALGQVGPDQPLIFDLRGYPHGVKADFLGHLTSLSVDTPPFRIAVTQLPDAQGREWETVGWEVSPTLPRLRGRIAFLTDERAISYAETLLAIVQGHDLAEIVGEPTAGMNGNINPFVLPGNHRIVWTGMRVVNHDGSDLVGHGIQPSAPVSATIAGIREGRDEVLERGIEVVTQHGAAEPGTRAFSRVQGR